MNQKVSYFPTESWQFHILFWVVYWIMGAAQDALSETYFQENFNIPIVLGSIGIVYFNYYYWLPKYLIQKKQYLFYTLSIAVFIIANAWLFNFLLGFFIFENVYYFSWESAFVMSVDTSVIVAFTTAFKFMQKWNERNQYAKELERKNLESELEMLKSQINPHFIFNTLNTIYFLMEQKDENAKVVLLKFSDILSHQLYDYNKEFIELSSEVEYLENYIALQRFRHDKEMLLLNWDFPKQVGSHKIVPMLLIPFLENAFKHGANSNGFQIDVHLSIENNVLHFITKNTINPNPVRKKGVGGIGVKNVQRRLELIYKNRHELVLKNDGKWFVVDLKIQLK